MVEQVSRPQVCGGLRDELSSLHLRVPGGRRVDGHFQPSLLSRVGGVLVRGIEIQVVGG